MLRSVTEVRKLYCEYIEADSYCFGVLESQSTHKGILQHMLLNSYVDLVLYN